LAFKSNNMTHDYAGLLEAKYSPATIPQLADILQRANYVANGAKSCAFNVSTPGQFKEAVEALHWLQKQHKGMQLQGNFQDYDEPKDGAQVSVTVSFRSFRVVYRPGAHPGDAPKLTISEPILFEKQMAK
jgi:hypothetical protein